MRSHRTSLASGRLWIYWAERLHHQHRFPSTRFFHPSQRSLDKAQVVSLSHRSIIFLSLSYGCCHLHFGARFTSPCV
ncbi:hypothetical protein BOTBODRAFT_330953 [Botryobasidium botryosum FD-172 SS1]|uniref:Uncharacterized protein n=1 Tax=Botryobasidium botryosum (strain FD-172 SS1) TaxID=930990 RepID=A0A067MSQ3_BOTB1|nr:hypothetical protein BOTBODRAFT_330953 [Botryobasidium botryosum FD-172 SS1]